MAGVRNKLPGTKVAGLVRRIRTSLGLWVAGAKFKAGQSGGQPRCSFCGLVCDPFDTVVVVYKGPLDVWICRECVAHCKVILDAAPKDVV